MPATNDHRWNTKEYEIRTRKLYRTELHKLYPSEAWTLYRILPNCKSVIDLGCGNGAMAAITKQIAPNAQYTGVDHQTRLIKEARDAFSWAEFHASDLESYLERCEPADCVMSWSVIKSFKNWRDILAGMLKKARKYVICDIRVANTDAESFDVDVCHAEYGGKRGPIILVNYPIFCNALLEHRSELARIEIAGYQSEWGEFVHFVGPAPDTFLIVSVLVKKGVQLTQTEPFELFERLPDNLSR